VTALKISKEMHEPSHVVLLDPPADAHDELFVMNRAIGKRREEERKRKEESMSFPQ